METAAETTALIKRAYWLVKLRWIATVSVGAGTCLAGSILGIALQDIALYSIAGLLAFYNLAMLLLLNCLAGGKCGIRGFSVKTVINFQISADLLILTFLLHFSGGIENPLSFYFIFHMIIASILLSVKESCLQAAFAVVVFGLLILLEYLRIIPHYCLKGFTENCSFQNAVYVFGTYFVFVTAMFTVVYMAGHIATKLKKAEAAYRDANSLLRKKDRIKDEYVLRVTHDIKSDLAAIQSCIDVIKDQLVGPLNEQQTDFIDRAVARTKKVTYFVKNLLRLTQMRLANKLKMDKFSLKDTIRDAVTAIEAKAQDKSITLDYNVESSVDEVSGNRFSIEEMITNILLNAVKYTPSNGTVKINAKDNSDSVLVEVIDTGIGIPQEEIPKVFYEFYRVSNARKVEKDGTGLGLSIAKQIIERHGGKIWVESRENVGTKFAFTLPKDHIDQN